MEEQVVAANVDTVFLVSGLDANYNLRRIERYLIVAWDSGATPVVILNKVDLCDAPERHAEEVGAVAPGVDVHLVSAETGAGMSALHTYLGVGRTLAFLGSSGVGKSSLINHLLGENRQAVASVRGEDDKGRHTTRCRELIPLPEGGLLIDTPGMRELQLWSDGVGLARAFDDIETLAVNCKFSDCMHNAEPGCAVRAAVEAGEMDTARFESYRKMRSELAFLEERRDKTSDQIERGKWRGVAKEIKRFYKRQGRQ